MYSGEGASLKVWLCLRVYGVEVVVEVCVEGNGVVWLSVGFLYRSKGDMLYKGSVFSMGKTWFVYILLDQDSLRAPCGN